ncbi:bifunctional diguanylate cyclase/phosphodiesterase [Mangrovibacillus cuniculi]|uniref:EAL domain-containing protein n=1 Tax=Mangrovibacillus cuniculi TaxID=2593652 RepID=A0A7S8CA26_9BACI|nr:bifunctional diguanylate cyclase/phosphodiesterase [Mangrovibacillus cuniculi]QPC46170.1 EAL domain-containing protein [Mangrovibacillus cuniculi]
MDQAQHAQAKSDGIMKIILYILDQHLSDMVFLMEVHNGYRFTYSYVNEYGLIHAGLSPDSIGKTFQEVLPHDLAKEMQTVYEKVVKTKQNLSYVDEMQERESSRFYESKLTFLPDIEPGRSFVVSVTREVTKGIQEKQLLLDSEQRFRSFVDHNDDGVIAINFDGVITESNDSAKKILQFHDNSQKNFLHEYLDTNDKEEVAKAVERTKNGEITVISDVKCKVSPTKVKTIQFKTVPIMVNGDVVGVYVILRDETEKVEKAEKIEYMTLHDHLTGLWNRKALLEDLQKNMSPSNGQHPFALLYMDLDRFKHINDAFGHKKGDSLLREIADRLVKFVHSEMKVYRQGGDEFIILVPAAGMKEAERAANLVNEIFEQPFVINDQEIFLSPSIGISLYPTNGTDAETLIKHADHALYEVKDKGRAHYRFFHTEMNESFSNAVMLESHLRRAIEMDELSLHYQPQVNLITGDIESFEALLRWNNGKFGMVPPSQFIPLAEKTGLILSIGRWVIEEACRQLNSWNNKGINTRVAINISPKQFFQSDFVGHLKWALEHFSIEPSSLEIEVTEGAMEDTRTMVSVLQEVKETGIIISVDDFGTGYSSLHYLKRFPIDILKIDQSFVREMMRNEKDAAITQTIIHLAHHLGLEVVAEGVEEEEQVNFLKKFHCQKAQGYFFSKPKGSMETEAFLLEYKKESKQLQ